MSDKIRWGILGCANIAQKALIPGLLAANNAILQAVASRDSAKLADFVKRFKPKTGHIGYEALLADPEVEAVYIPLPNHLHKEWVLKAAAAGKHVLCEKPLGLSEAEVREMHEACRAAGVILMEAFAYRHSPITREVKRMITSGAVGRLQYVEAGFSFVLDNPSNVRQFKAMGGGATYDIGCYTLDVIRHLVDEEPLSVHAEGDLHPQSGIDLGSSVLMKFPNGARAYSWCSFASAFRSDYLVVGSTGTIRVPSPFNAKGNLEIRLFQDGKERSIKIKTPDNYCLEVEQMGRCIRNGDRPLVDATSSLATARLIERVLKQINY